MDKGKGPRINKLRILEMIEASRHEINNKNIFGKYNK